jgi:hypothetical protein
MRSAPVDGGGSRRAAGRAIELDREPMRVTREFPGCVQDRDLLAAREFTAEVRDDRRFLR